MEDVEIVMHILHYYTSWICVIWPREKPFLILSTWNWKQYEALLGLRLLPLYDQWELAGHSAPWVMYDLHQAGH